MKWYKLKQKILKTRIKGIKYLYIQYYRSILRNHCSHVGIHSSFQSEPILPHGLYGIFISNGATIGKNCVIFHQVTIGSNTLEDSKGRGAPTVGDNVYIGAGAKIIGRVKIGNNVRIGANCVVVENIPDDCVVVLNKPRILQKSNILNKFIVYDHKSDS